MRARQRLLLEVNLGRTTDETCQIVWRLVYKHYFVSNVVFVQFNLLSFSHQKANADLDN